MRITEKKGPYLTDKAKITFSSVGFFMLFSLE